MHVLVLKALIYNTLCTAGGYHKRARLEEHMTPKATPGGEHNVHHFASDIAHATAMRDMCKRRYT